MAGLEIDPDLRVGGIGHDDVLALVAVQVTDVQRPPALVALRQCKECEPPALVGVVSGRLVEREHPAPARLAFEDQDLRAPLAVDLSERDRVRQIERKTLLRPELFLVGRESDMDRVIAFGVDDHDVLRLVAVDVDRLDQPREHWRCEARVRARS